jgi:hypothetical protein
MTPRAAHIDATLIEKRQVRIVRPDADGIGRLVYLSCGHEVWVVTMPPEAGDEMYCSLCLNTLVYQIRELQAEQRPGD